MDGITTSNKRDYGNHCMEPVPESDVFWNVSQYRLDDRIRQLCAKVVASSDQDLGPSIAELKAALRQHNERLRKLALAQLGRLWSCPYGSPLTPLHCASQPEP